jgi:hypothetical protein
MHRITHQVTWQSIYKKEKKLIFRLLQGLLSKNCQIQMKILMKKNPLVN